jgi:hypothetical protein
VTELPKKIFFFFLGFDFVISDMKFLNSYFGFPRYFVCYTKVTELPLLPDGNRTAELGHGVRTKVNYAIRLVDSLK